MPNRFFGFNNVDSAGATPYPGRSVAVTATVSNTTFVTFDVTSNLPNTTIKYNLVGASTIDFTDATVTDSFTTDANGSYSFNKSLITTSLSNANIEFYADILSVSDLSLATSTNVSILNIVPMEATGGIITFSNGYKVHTFYDNSFFTVNSINNESNADVYVQVVGGGGAGGVAKTNVQIQVFVPFPDPGVNLRKIDSFPGGGGGGGNAIIANVTVNNFSVGSYTATVGAGGNGSFLVSNVSLRAGQNSSFLGYTATGGGPGGSYNNAASAGYVTGGGGGTQISGANTIGEYHITGNTTPVGQTLYGTWFNPDVSINGILYYKSEEPAVYTTWDNNGVPRLTANVFNDQGLRIANEGGNGTLFDGGNSVIGAILTTRTINNIPTIQAIAGAGGGAGITGNGYAAQGNWVIDTALPPEESRANIITGNGGRGLVTWGDDPTTTFISNLTLQYIADYGNTFDRKYMAGAGGGGGQVERYRGPFAGGLTLNKGNLGGFGSAAPSGSGGGGGGGMAVWNPFEERPPTGFTQEYVHSGGNGGSGIVKIAYLNTIRQFGE